MVDEPVRNEIEAEEVEQDQYLVFTIQSQEFGIQAMWVQEISQVLETTEVPNAPAYIDGIANLRGRLASVIDFRKKFGFEPKEHDVRFMEDDWEAPTLGASGVGWQVWLDGLEITQFTYFQQAGGIELAPIAVELTYGLERIAMAVQGVEHFKDIVWGGDGITYGEIYQMAEAEWSRYGYEAADIEVVRQTFDMCERESERLVQLSRPSAGDADSEPPPVLAKSCIIPAYEMVLKCSCAFNVLDARGALSVRERATYVGRVRNLARQVARAYLAQREALGYPLLKQKAKI